MEILEKLKDASLYMEDYRNCKKDNRKIQYCILFKDTCIAILDYIRYNESIIHDLDFEIKFEAYLYDLVCIVYKWYKADGIFRGVKERIQINKLNLQMEKVFEVYNEALLRISKDI